MVNGQQAGNSWPRLDSLFLSIVLTIQTAGVFDTGTDETSGARAPLTG